MPGSKCPSCGELAVIQDEQECQTVCEVCGVVLDSGFLVHNAGFNECPTSNWVPNYQNGNSTATTSSLPSDYLKRNTRQRVSSQKPITIRRMKEMAQVLKMNQHMVQEAQEYLDQVFSSYLVYGLKLEIKETVAALCLYLVGRRYGWPLTKELISQLARQRLSKVCFWLKELTKLLNIEITSPEIEELVPAQIQEWKLPESLSALALKVIEISRTAWLLEGRSQSIIVKAAIFLAYEYERTRQGKKNVLGRKAFCSEIKVDLNSISPQVMKHVKTIKDIMCTLAKEVPWLDQEFTCKNIVAYLPDILENQKSLVYDTMKKIGEESRTEEEDEEDSESISENVGEETKRKSETLDIPLTPVESQSRTTRSDHDTCTEGACDYLPEDSEPKSKKARKVGDIFLPRCYVINRQKSIENKSKPVFADPKPFIYHGDLDSCELNEHDISEAELKEYLRSEDQIKVIAHLYE